MDSVHFWEEVVRGDDGLTEAERKRAILAAERRKTQRGPWQKPKGGILHVGHKRPFYHPTKGRNGPVTVRKPE